MIAEEIGGGEGGGGGGDGGGFGDGGEGGEGGGEGGSGGGGGEQRAVRHSARHLYQSGDHPEFQS